MSVPDLFTVTEAAAILRVGRTTAYELAARDVATGGGEGLGVVRVGGQLRVRRAALELLLGGPVTWPLATGADQRAELGDDNVVQLTVAAVDDGDSAVSSSGSPSLPFGS